MVRTFLVVVICTTPEEPQSPHTVTFAMGRYYEGEPELSHPLRAVYPEDARRIVRLTLSTDARTAGTYLEGNERTIIRIGALASEEEFFSPADIRNAFGAVGWLEVDSADITRKFPDYHPVDKTA